MTASRASLLGGLCAALVMLAGPAAAQLSFDDRPTGFLTPRAGGMPPGAWADTTLASAKRLVASLPAAPRSRALRDLQFKVLVSELLPPAPDGSPPPGLFRQRVERLAAMGEGESLNEVVRSAGAHADPAIAAITVNALMLAGEREAACNIVARHALPDPFGLRAALACQLAAGDNAGAMASAAQVRNIDPALVALVEMAAGARPPAVQPQAILDGPTFVMLDLAYVPPPPLALRATQPPLVRAVVGHRTVPLAQRVDIAERGESLAIVEAARLSDLYADAVRAGAALPPPQLRRAQLVVRAREAAGSAEIMASIAAIYGDARNSVLFPTVARASAAGLLNLPPQPRHADVAQEAMRGFLLLGDPRLVREWTRLALLAARNNARALAALDRLMPLVAISGTEPPRALPPDEVNRWYEVIRQDDPARAPLRGHLLLELLRATGADIAPQSTELPEAPPAGARLVSAQPATLQALARAATARRQAETSLLAAIAAGDTALVELHPASVGAIVRTLRAVGEDHAARLFAIEVAIAHGL